MKDAKPVKVLDKLKRGEARKDSMILDRIAADALKSATRLDRADLQCSIPARSVRLRRADSQSVKRDK